MMYDKLKHFHRSRWLSPVVTGGFALPRTRAIKSVGVRETLCSLAMTSGFYSLVRSELRRSFPRADLHISCSRAILRDARIRRGTPCHIILPQ